jgi:carboxyl-terminal processing protease
MNPLRNLQRSQTATFALISLFTAFSCASLLSAYRLNAAPSPKTATRVQRIAQDDSLPDNAKAPTDGSDENLPAQADAVEDYKTALALIKNQYYGKKVDSKEKRKLTYEALRGMLSGLRDPFTTFLDPEEWGQMQATTRGNFEGIGAILTQEGAEIKIEEPFENSPAEKAGIKPDDVIVRVDGQPVLGKTVTDVVKLIKGKAGTQVRLNIVRGKTDKVITVTRASVEPPVVKYFMQDTTKKIGYIQLKEFNEKSSEQLQIAFRSLKQQGMKALVFDLRGNPGGLLDTAIQVSSMFIQKDSKPDLKNVVVYIREGSGQESRKSLRGSQYLEGGIPLVVLVNEGSASASEIVSGAIKDYGAGTLIGERTYGKGRVQTLYPLPDDSALRLTTALYFPPKHQDLNFKHDEDGNRIPNTGGILPDIEVKQPDTWKGFKDRQNDLQLVKATELLRLILQGTPVSDARKQVSQKQ